VGRFCNEVHRLWYIPLEPAKSSNEEEHECP
jgi:hypothetical protein